MKSVSLVFLLILAETACTRLSVPRAASAVPPTPVLQPEEANDETDRGEVEDDGHATEFYLKRRVAPGETTLSLDRYIAAREHSRQMPTVSLAAMSRNETAKLSGGSWTSLGPGNVGGRTRSLVINPQNPNIMYAGAVTGGVWKTTDGGNSWTALTDMLPVLNIGALVMDPNDSNTLYAGTGEYYKAFPGQGIFKTSDGGATWNLLTQTGTNVTNAFEYVNRLVMSPTTPNRLYAATWSGVFTSADGGNTWVSTGMSPTYNGCQDLAIRTDQTTDYLYASCSGRTFSNPHAIWRNTSAAGGGAWAQVYTALYMGRTSLALAPSQQSTIYAMAASIGGDPRYEEGLLAVYRSTSNGDAGSWTTQVSNADPDITNTLLLTDSRSVTLAFCNGGALTYTTGQGSYDNALAVDPNDPNRVWAGGIDVFRSDDGGMTWGAASLWQLPYGSPQFAHADRHLFVFHPAYNGSSNQTMFLATDGGLFRTDNARATVSTGPNGTCQNVFTSTASILWADLNHSYVATQYYHGVSYPGGQAYLSGAQDNSVTRGNDAAGSNGFMYFSTGDGASVALDPADANRMFESKQYVSLARATNGLNVVSATSGITELSNTFPFIAFLAMDPHEGKRLFLGGTTNLWLTQDAAATWTAAAPVAGGNVSSIAVSPFDSNTVLFGTQFGYIYRSTSALTSDGRTPWASALPRIGSVSSLAFDPMNPTVVYAVYSSLKAGLTDAHVYRSADGGVTWTPSDGSGSASLPDTPSFRLLVNPYNDQDLYLGTDLGIYASQDGGNTWSRDTSMEQVIVEELALDNGAQSNWLFAFTFGRGIYRIPLPGAPNPSCTYSVSPTSISANAFGSIVPVTVTAPAGCSWIGLPGSFATQFYVQSPAQGSGSGTAFVVVEPNTTETLAVDQLTIANTVIPITQEAAAVSFTIAPLPTAPTVLSVPGEGVINSENLALSPTGPVQSCSGSAGYKTAWWMVTAPASGYLQARAYGRRYIVFGNSGIVITAYPQIAPSDELACAQVPRDSNYEIDAVIQFPVTAGSNYLIEIAATGATATDGGYTALSVTQGAPPASVTVTPATATLTANSGGSQQFSAQVANAPNSGVRWSLSPPLGLISTSGLYTPPASIGAPATVNVTATPFADPTKQSSAIVSLLPAAGAPPTVSLVATANAQSPNISQNTWIEIKGSNLAPDTRTWQAVDFVNNQMPIELDGVSVTVDGKPAFVYYISPNQVNVLTPLDANIGPVELQLSTAAGTAAPVTAQMQPYSTEFFVFKGGPYVAAAHLDGSYLGPASLYPGVTTPAAPGELVVLFANGFGQTTPPIVNRSTSQSGTLPTLPLVTIGGIPARVQFAGVVSPGLYQFNVEVPANVPTGDNALVATYNGLKTQSNVLITVIPSSSRAMASFSPSSQPISATSITEPAAGSAAATWSATAKIIIRGRIEMRRLASAQPAAELEFQHLATYGSKHGIHPPKILNRRPAKAALGEDEHPYGLGFPSGVVSDTKHRVWIADSGTQSVHVFDPATGAYREIRRAGDATLQQPCGLTID